MACGAVGHNGQEHMPPVNQIRGGHMPSKNAPGEIRNNMFLPRMTALMGALGQTPKIVVSLAIIRYSDPPPLVC